MQNQTNQKTPLKMDRIESDYKYNIMIRELILSINLGLYKMLFTCEQYNYTCVIVCEYVRG